jgi:3',5'-cyclic AMP phosphodiesterase CpdA
VLRKLNQNLLKKTAFTVFFIITIAVLGADALSKTTVSSDQPWSHLEMNNEPNNFQFAIVSDRTGEHREGVFEDAISRLNLLQPEFVMCVGDLIEGYSEDEETINEQWDEVEGLVSKIEMPFFYVPGNHDISNELALKIWKERFGRSYNHFVYKDVLFLCLNSEDIGEGNESPYITEKQKDYAAKVLEENKDVRWTLVFFHAPLWLAAEYGDDIYNVGCWVDIEELLKNRKHTVIAGHVHRHSHYQRNNANYIILSTTGGGSKLRGPMFGEFDHVVWVTMTEEGPRIANLMLSGILDEKLSLEYLKAGLRGRIIRTKSYYYDDWGDKDIPFKGSDVTMRLTNDVDVPMKLSLDFHSKGVIKVVPESLEYTVAGNSVEKIDIMLKTERALDHEDIETEEITCNWKARFKLPNKTDALEITGTYRLVK